MVDKLDKGDISPSLHGATYQSALALVLMHSGQRTVFRWACSPIAWASRTVVPSIAQAESD